MSSVQPTLWNPSAVDNDRSFTMRPYQSEAVVSIYNEWDVENVDSTLLVQATGLGKTVCLSEVIRQWDDSRGRILVMAHRDELIFQAVNKIADHTGERPQIEMAKYRASPHVWMAESNVIVTTVQTMSKPKRMERFDPHDFGLLVIDEAHHAPAASYRRVIEHFSVGGLKVLGVTATPHRKDKKAMGAIFESCASEMNILDGIEGGWLCDIEQKYVVVDGLDFSSVRTTAGDLNERDLAELLGGAVSDEEEEALRKQEAMIHKIVGPTIEEADGRPTLVFAVTKEHARRLTEVFNRHDGVTAACVLAETPRDERRDIIRRFQNYDLQVLVGVGVFTEGFDAPATACVAIARPTKSTLLYTQMIGRGTRPLPGLVDEHDTASDRINAILESEKPSVTILDFVGNSGRHKLVSSADVLGGEYDLEDIAAAREAVQNGGEAGNMRDALRDALEDRERREEEERRREEERKAELQRRLRIRAEAQYRSQAVDPFGNQSVPDRIIGSFRGGASDKQIKFLAVLGVPEERSRSFTQAQAGAVISDLAGREGRDWIMRFGKHKGKALKDVPPGYLHWAAGEIDHPEFRKNLGMFRGGV